MSGGLELKNDLERVPLSAIIGERDQVSASANRIFLSALALSKVVRGIRNRPFGLPLELAFAPSKLHHVANYPLTDRFFGF